MVKGGHTVEQRLDLTLDKEKIINCVYGMLRKMAQAGKEQKYQQISTNLFQTMKKVEELKVKVLLVTIGCCGDLAKMR